MTYNKKIDIQILSVSSDNIGNQIENWVSLNSTGFWAYVNGTGGREYYSARAVNSENDFTFRIRYTPAVASYRCETQKIRIVYNNIVFDVKHIDDYREQHMELIIKAESVSDR